MTEGKEPIGPNRLRPASRPGRTEALCVGLLTVLAAAVRVADLGGQGLWYDEAWTYDLARSPLSLMFDRLPAWESTPPLYYLAAWGSVRLFGGGEAAVRLPAAVAGIATVPAMWGAARSFAGSRAGVVAAALTAFSPFMWWYSQEARAYSLAAFFCALSLWFMARALRTGSWSDLIGWGAASALAVLSQYPAGIVFAVSAVVLVARSRGHRLRVAAAAAAPVACGISLIPLAAEQRSTGRSDWISSFPLQGRLEQIVSQAWFGSPVFPSGFALDIAAAGCALVVLLLVVAARRRVGVLGDAVKVPALVAFGTVGVLAVAALSGTDILLARNLIVIWPAAMVAISACVSALGRKPATAFTAAASVAMLLLIGWVQLNPDLQRNDFRKAASLLGAVPEGGRLVVFQAFPYSRPLTVYMRGEKRPGRQRVRVGELAVLSMELPSVRWCWWGGVCSDGIRREYSSRPLGAQRLAGFAKAETRTNGRFTMVVYRAPGGDWVDAASVKAELPERLHGLILWQP